jgi:protein dithiol oxidoreductase (disulfide-forming)
MKNWALLTSLLLAWPGMLLAQAGAADTYREGVHYNELNQAASPRSADGVTVTEIFSYGCHACNEFEPFIQNWKSKQAEDVTLNRIPVGFGRRAWELLAKGYMMAEIMGIEDESHVPMMNAIWKEGRQMRSLEDLADFYAEHGADRDKFLALDQGFMLSMRQKQNNDKLGLYAPRQTPTIIVNGKYKVQTGQNVPSYQALLNVVDFLVQKERAAMAPVAETAAAETAGN